MSNSLDTKYRINLHYQERRSRYYAEDLGSGISLNMVEIPGGRFLMGSPETEAERLDNESPQHEVALREFFIGMYPITQAQWGAIANLAPVNQEINSHPANFKGENHPVERVSWNDATEFCARLSKQTGRNYRLPTEAEWEYACRSGTQTPFYFGKTLTTDLANYDGNYTYNNGPNGDSRQQTTSVDHFGLANAFGLCDMHGNIYEWCEDHWHNNYEDAPTDGSAWLNENKNNTHVLRGGSWYHYPKYCRSASRIDNLPSFTAFTLGFRVVCRAPSTF